MQEIHKAIYYETAYAGVTLGALTLSHGTILIDAPLRVEDARLWRGAVQALSANANRLLVNLDTHPDRTLGARAMECPVVSHQKVAQAFRSRPSVFKGQNADSGSEWEAQNDAVGTRWAIPDITFTHHLHLHWGPPSVFLEYHPGPATGAIWAIVPAAKIVFVGDAVLVNQPPFLAGADIPAWLEGLALLLKDYRDFQIISGRGGLVTVEAVQFQKNLLTNILRGLDKLARRKAAPEETETLVPSLLSELGFTSHTEEQYMLRLRHGLYQYYARRHRPIEASDQD